MNMNKGAQIASMSVRGERIDWSSVEFGFIMKMHPDGRNAWCRYWMRDHAGKLRTLANSELTPLENIIEYHSVDQEIVDKTIAMIESDEEKG